MTDRRMLWANDHVAHSSLRGQVAAPYFTEGVWAQISGGKVPLLDAADGKRERELLFGEPFCVLDRRDGHAFGYTPRDGYAGYIAEDCLHDSFRAPSHTIVAPRSYMKGTPDLKAYEPVHDLSFGSFVEVLAEQGAWAGIGVRFHDEPGKLFTNWIPKCHLNPVGDWQSDPVAIAKLFLGTPYLWGGNSGFGIDCSGLIQAALLACNIPCPGDSDQQQAALGDDVSDDSLRRGDLLFWRGHVAMAVDATTLIHANAFHMAVAYEPIERAIARISEQGDGPVTAHKRLEMPI